MCRRLAVNAYLKNLTSEAREEVLHTIVREDSGDTRIDGPALAALIESAKAAAMIDSEAWQDGGDPLVKKTLDFIREQLPAVDGKEYVKKVPESFLRFIEDCAKQ